MRRKGRLMADYAPKRVRETSTQIVQNYLDMLLSDVSSFEPEIAPVSPELLPEEQTQETATTTAVPQTTPLVEPKAETAQPTSERSSDWRKQDFASLLFDVGGLQLAAPLRHLGGISQLSTPLQTVAGQADWFLGLMRWNGRNIRVIDTARLIMPERVDAVGISEYQSMVVLGDSHWALAANEVIESLTLAPGDVKWRTGSAQRPWLSGMLAQRLCVLMDVERLIEMLELHDIP